MVLNKEIQSQQRLDSLGEATGPASPRQPRKALVSSESYLQRLSMASSGSLWQEIPVVRNSTVLLSMTHEDQKLQEVPSGAGLGQGVAVQEGEQSLMPISCSPPPPLITCSMHAMAVPGLHADASELLSGCYHRPCSPLLQGVGPLPPTCCWSGFIPSDHAPDFVGRDVQLLPSLLAQARLKLPSSIRVPHYTEVSLFN